MREIVERLHEKRQIELAKSILESEGYTITKLDEASFDDVNHGESEQGRLAADKKGRKPNADLKDDGVFTPGNADEEDSKNSYTVYYTESTERGRVFRHVDLLASSEEDAREKVELMFQEWSDRDIYHIESINKVDESVINENEDEWDPYRGKKYKVYAGYGSDSLATDDPKEAIEAWFKFQLPAPTDTSIMAKTKADAVALNKVATEEYLTDLYNQYECPYKLDYLISEAAKKVADGQRGFYEDKYGYGDQIHPFGVG